MEAWACVFWKLDSSKGLYFLVSLSLWQALGQVVKVLWGEVFKMQLRQVPARDLVLVICNNTKFWEENQVMAES